MIKDTLETILKMKASDLLSDIDMERLSLHAGHTVEEALGIAQAVKAIGHSDTQAFNAILDRTEGKPHQTQAISHDVSYEDIVSKVQKEREE